MDSIVLAAVLAICFIQCLMIIRGSDLISDFGKGEKILFNLGA